METHRLITSLRDLVKDRGLKGAEFEDPSLGKKGPEPLDVIVVNDEVARLYKDSTRAAVDHPTFSSLTRYCVALANYLQNPMEGVCSARKRSTSLSFHPCQHATT